MDCYIRNLMQHQLQKRYSVPHTQRQGYTSVVTTITTDFVGVTPLAVWRPSVHVWHLAIISVNNGFMYNSRKESSPGDSIFCNTFWKNGSFLGGYLLFPVLKFLLHSEENDDAFAIFWHRSELGILNRTMQNWITFHLLQQSIFSISVHLL